MKNSILFLLCSLFLLVNSTIGQEHVMVSGKDSLVITKEEVPEEVLKKMQAYDFGSEIKKFNESAYGVFNFNDDDRRVRSEEHTSELQSRPHLVCRLLLEKKKDTIIL